MSKYIKYIYMQNIYSIIGKEYVKNTSIYLYNINHFIILFTII